MLRIDRNRLWSDLEALGRIGAGARGRTRLAFSLEDLEARRLLVRWMEELGLEVHSDAHANLWGVRMGTEPALAPVVAGSHIDTVREAGMFDGTLGVLSGLAAVRAMNEAGIVTRRPVAVASFSDEEGGRFAAGGLAGSRAMAGLLTDGELGAKRDEAGISWLEAAAQSGFVGSDRLEPHAYLEYHIEQGPVLCDEGTPIGVVEGIVSLSWLRFTFRGQANHAGAFPMDRRHDASLAAACASVALNRLALELGEGTVITAGQLELKPNLANIVPGEAILTVDIRQFRPELFEEALERAERTVRAEAERLGVEVAVERLSRAEGAVFLPEMTAMVERHARALGYRTRRMPSGAGHDAQILNRLCPTAMIFCPSAGGRSHCPEEFSSLDEGGAGADVLLNCLLELAER